MSAVRAVRTVVFWLHLSVAVAAGAVIIIMSATGVLLAYQKPVLSMVAARHRVAAPANGARLPLDSIVARVPSAPDTASVASITVSNDGTLPLTVGLSDRRSVFVDPYSARVLGSDEATRGFFQSVERWHRSLAIGLGTRSKIGTTITGMVNIAFLFLVVSGFFLWWPRRWTPRAFAAVLFFRRRAHGRQRLWNWHHVLGFWAAPVLFLIVSSAVFMSYTWPQQAVARLVGVPTGSSGGGAGGAKTGAKTGASRGQARGEHRPRASLDTLIAHVAPRAGWETIQLRLPQAGARTAAVTVSYGATGRPDRRDQITLDASTAAVMPSQGYNDYDPARKIRAWARPIHTGEAGGIIGETIVALAASAAVVLGFTGLLLAFRRLRSRSGRSRGPGSRLEVDVLELTELEAERPELVVTVAQVGLELRRASS
ncbi:MAG TPA: PepSY-associated TM helix domain-containing protein [Gemmatimonadaceae bacterium]|jgi:uncharacterized iron-regulated membrane protein